MLQRPFKLRPLAIQQSGSSQSPTCTVNELDRTALRLSYISSQYTRLHNSRLCQSLCLGDLVDYMDMKEPVATSSTIMGNQFARVFRDSRLEIEIESVEK